MNKPKRSDFPDGRTGAKPYQAALEKWRTSQEEKRSKDPKPRWSSKKYKNYEAFRQDVKAWRIRNGFEKAPEPKKKKEYVSPRDRKFGKKKLKINKEIDQQVDKYVADRKVPINRDLTKDNRKNIPNKDNNKDNNTDNNTDNKNKGPNLEAANKILSGNRKEVTMDDFKSDNTDKKNEQLKISPYRRTKGEGIEKKGGGYRGDTRITKKLKKAGFTETRLAKLREKNAAFQKAKKGGKKAMEEYRRKYPKRG